MHANTAVAGAMKGATKAMASMNKVKHSIILLKYNILGECQSCIKHHDRVLFPDLKLRK